MSKPAPDTAKDLVVDLKESKRNFRRIDRPEGPDQVLGSFSFIVDITAATGDVYIPLSIASGKKPTGFVYQIEGTAEGEIVTTDISCRGDGVTQITLGTLLYCKIPSGMTATFRIRIEIRGKVGKSYRVVIHQLHYKHDPSEARYQKSSQEISTKMLKFS